MFSRKNKPLFLLIVLSFVYCTGNGDLLAQETASLQPDRNNQLVEWIQSHKSPLTGLPLSFHIRKSDKDELLADMGESDSITGIIERMIVEEGTSVYDTAVWQIALLAVGGRQNVVDAAVPVNTYWRGSLRHLNNLRAGRGGGQHFIYDLSQPEAISSDLKALGRRGFVFRILNAHGKYLTQDPLDDKTRLEGFPNWPELHWEDWKPIAGENAWIVIAAMQLYHHKYYNEDIQSYQHNTDSLELNLAEEIARAAIHLQAKNGAVRMAPIGTYFFSLDEIELGTALDVAKQLDSKAAEAKENYDAIVNELGEEHALLHSYHTTWYFNEISTENNLSWYTAFRLLFEVTQNTDYRLAMLRIERYLKTVWDEEKKYLYQGAHLIDGFWEPNKVHFATDVQTWGIGKLGPELIDKWFGQGAAYEMWQTTKELSGVYDSNGFLRGVGYTTEDDRLSVEWTVGAIYATEELADYYRNSHSAWSEQAAAEAKAMRAGIEQYRIPIDKTKAGYAYSSRRGWIPFGWFSHDKRVVSLVSTCWVILHDLGFNPFHFPIRK